MNTRISALVLLAAVATACSGEGQDGLYGTQESYVLGSALTSNTFPTMVNPGEKLNVRVVMRNTGTVPVADDWIANQFQLYSVDSPLVEWGWVSDPLAVNTPVGQDGVFDFVVTAPPAGMNLDFRAMMYSGQNYFGQVVNIGPITSSANVQRRWDCSFVSSTFPAQMTPSEQRTVSVTVRNTGTATWPATGLCLYSRDDTGNPPNFGKWGSASTCVPLTMAVAPNTNTTFTFDVVAPSTNGTQTFLRQMFDSNPPSPTGGVGLFDALNNCVNISVTIGAAAAGNNAVVVSHTLPSQMAAGETRNVTVRLRNTGSETWTTDGNYELYSQNNPVTLWGIVNIRVPQVTAPFQEVDITFPIRAPATPGMYNHRWQMIKYLQPNSGFFGQLLDVPVTVGAAPADDASVVSQTIPSQIQPGANATFSITMRNDGTSTWDQNFALVSNNNPVGLWTTTVVPIANGVTVAPGASYTFTFQVTAPTQEGSYTSRWRMRNAAAVEFGDQAITNNIVVSNCGNGVTNAAVGETCDDGNLTNGDGCSSTCQFEPINRDIAATGSNKQIRGSASLAQMGNVAIGDVTNDGVVDVVVAELRGASTSTMTRNNGGTVYGYVGGNGFFTNNATTAPGRFEFRIWGADEGDELGGGPNGGLAIADVTGEQAPDLIVSAPKADGVNNARADAGEIYVFFEPVGRSLEARVTIDLANNSDFIRARIIGPAAGSEINILAVGDVDGDNIGDLLIGSQWADPQGRTDAGEVYLLKGGGTLSGTIDLAAGLANPNILAIIQGASAGDRIGTSGAIGNFGGGANNDIVIGSWLSSPGGRTRAGTAYGMFGPVTGLHDLSVGAAADVRWLGGDMFGQFGKWIRISDVRGDATADVLIGANQMLNPNFAPPGSQRGGVDIWTGPVAPGTLDYSAGATPGSRIFGQERDDLTGQTFAVADLNGDGKNDMVIMAPGGDGAANNRSGSGTAHVVFGATGLAAQTDLNTAAIPMTLFGPTSGALMGLYPYNVAAGRIDTDTKADFCVGSWNTFAGGQVDCFRSPW